MQPYEAFELCEQMSHSFTNWNKPWSMIGPSNNMGSNSTNMILLKVMQDLVRQPCFLKSKRNAIKTSTQNSVMAANCHSLKLNRG